MGKESKVGWLVLLGKLGPKLFTVFLKIWKTAKVGKVGLVAASAASYAYMFTWQFAAVILVSLFVHESGHAWAMKRCGMQVKGMYFIPFLGAAVVSEGSFKSRWGEAFIALAGPVWGMALAIAAAVVYETTGEPMWAALAGWMAMLNLLNLLPVNPLDGGRVWKSVAFSINTKAGLMMLFGGTLIAAGAAFLLNSVLFGVLAIIGGLELWVERKKELKARMQAEVSPESEEEVLEAYGVEYEMPVMTKLELAVTVAAYFTVAGTLFYVMDVMSHEPGAELAKQVLVDK